MAYIVMVLAEIPSTDLDFVQMYTRSKNPKD
jgi:hypothetical protein